MELVPSNLFESINGFMMRRVKEFSSDMNPRALCLESSSILTA